VESFADRLCIMGEAPSGTILSPEPILDCSIEGCGGGYPKTAWNWMMNNGDTTCTGQCFSGCCPYDSGAGTSPACHKGTCDSGASWPITYTAGSFSALTANDLTQFQNELYANGPLQACFTVYNNFYTFFDAYPNGIYSTYSGGVVGGHCVKMIGWGTSGGTPYWTFANSWDTTWGDSGYFMMLRGSNLCGIEGEVSEGFTQGQIVAHKAAGKFHPNLNVSSFKVGGWYEQDPADFTNELNVPAVEAAINLASMAVGRRLQLQKVIAIQTQVVAGVNFKMVLGVEGKALTLTLFRDLKFHYHLISHRF